MFISVVIDHLVSTTGRYLEMLRRLTFRVSQFVL